MTFLFGLLACLQFVASPDPSGAAAAAQPSSPTLEYETVEGRMMEVRLCSISDGILHYTKDDESGRVRVSDLVRVAVTDQQDASADHRIAANCTLFLAGGSSANARLLPDAGDDRRIRVDMGLPEAMEIPLTALRAIRLTTKPLELAEEQLASRMTDRDAGRDFLIAVRDGRPVVVPGALERLTPDAWSFRVGDKLQTAPLDRAYAIVLGTLKDASAPGSASVRLDAARSLVGQIASADTSELLLDAGPLGRVRIPWHTIESIALRSDRIVDLSELEPSRVEQRSLFDASWPPQRDKNVTGGPILLGGRRYDRGMGVHAYTALSYDLAGQFEQFTAVIGIDDAVAPHGRAIFRVHCDDRVAYESQPIGSGRPTTIKVDLSGVKTMTLICDPGDDLDFSDHCNWAAARLIRIKADAIR